RVATGRKVERVGPADEVDGARTLSGARRDGVVAAAASDGLDVAHRQRVGAVAEVQHVAGAASQVDGAAGKGGSQCQGVVAAAAGDGVDVGDRQRVATGR